MTVQINSKEQRDKREMTISKPQSTATLTLFVISSRDKYSENFLGGGLKLNVLMLYLQLAVTQIIFWRNWWREGNARKPFRFSLHTPSEWFSCSFFPTSSKSFLNECLLHLNGVYTFCISSHKHFQPLVKTFVGFSSCRR